MKAHDIRATLKDLSLLTITASTTEEDAMVAERKLASFNQCMVGLVRYSGQPPWERHPGGDELLHILEGEVNVTVLTDGGPVHEIARAGGRDAALHDAGGGKRALVRGGPTGRAG